MTGVAETFARALLIPTLPSRVMPSSFCASSANSIGSSLNTSLQNPFTIIDMACSALRPRCLQIEDLVLADLRRRRLVLQRRVVLHVDVRERVRAAPVAHQHGVALGVVSRARRPSGSTFTSPR